MISVGFDTKELSKTLNNVVAYTHGFTSGVKSAQITFNRELAIFVEEALKRYIDAKARGNPEALHHVYEWDMVGSPSGRLFEFSVNTSQNFISFVGSLLPSRTVSGTSTEPFVDKAVIMEKQITITIDPENSDFLAFEDDGELIFTSESIVIDTPGGSAVGGSFEAVVREFFNSYLTVGLLKSSGIFDKLRYAKEYSRRFAQGARTGASPGFLAGKEYLSLGGTRIE
jgi:hypothetical protein